MPVDWYGIRCSTSRIQPAVPASAQDHVPSLVSFIALFGGAAPHLGPPRAACS